MVIATSIQIAGSLHELTIPAKCADVLEWLRTKLKQPGLQYQGKISDKDSFVTIFAENGSDSDDNINQHILGGNFQDEIFVGTIIVMLSKSSNEDNYDKPASVYQNLKPTEYETLYAGWTFEDDEEDEPVEDDESAVEEEEEEEQVEEEVEVEVVKKTRIKIPPPIQDVNTDTPQRELVRTRFSEIGLTGSLSRELELGLLARSIRECAELGVEVGWTNPIFCNHYKGRCIQVYENLKKDSYVNNPTPWLNKLLSGEISAIQFAEMSTLEIAIERWKPQIDKQIEKDKHMYSNKGCASIYLYCSGPGCRKKSRCDYYQMQTRSADEPMTTFVTCLECDRRWKF
jgi:hypothetical protein